MGRRKISRRKPILQLDKGKKPEGSRVSSTSGVSNVEYSQTESGTGTTITIKTTAQSQESEAGGRQGLKSEEQMDSEIANFLKEISALGSGQEGEEGEVSTTESSSNETADQSGMSQDESEATQQVQPDSNPSDRFQEQSGASQTVAGEAGEGSVGDKERKEDSEPTVTFWQSVIDPNTNHAYYWNPATNEVCWTLPENGVISDEPLPDKGGSEGSTSSEGAAAQSSYADYYAYYAQAYYGVNTDQKKTSDQPKQPGSAKTEKVVSVPVATTQSDASATAASTEVAKESQKTQKEPLGPPEGKPEGESVPKSQSHVPVPILDAKQEEGFVGPTLPTAAAAADTASTDDVAMEIGGKQDSQGEGESRGASNGVKEPGKRTAVQESLQTTGARETRSVVAAGSGQSSEESVALQGALSKQPLRIGQKRKAPDADDGVDSASVAAALVDGEAQRGPGAKKPRHSPLSPERNPPKKKTQVSASPGPVIGVASKQAEQAVRLQVSMLADELTRKLQYLHISNEGVSDLQVLNIQLQTRLADWKDGGLSSKFLLGRFKQIARDLQLYEDQAAPEGWSCVWDSASCRYQFRNTATGESSWEYPLQAVLSPSSVEPQSSEISNQEETDQDQDTAAEGGREKENAVDKGGVGREGEGVVVAEEEGGERGGGSERRGEEDEGAQTDEGSQQLLDQEMEEVSDGDFSSEPEDQTAERQPLQPSQPAPASEPQPTKLLQREHQVEALEKVLTFLGTATPEQQQQLFSQTQLTAEQREQMLARARAMRQQKEQERQRQAAPAQKHPPPPPPTQQYRGPTAEYFYSPPEVPVTHRRSQQKQQADSRPPQEPQTTQKEAGLEEEERELSVEEVRQKLQRSRRPLVSYEKEEPGDIPGDEEQDTEEPDEEEEETPESRPETGMEFISEFPPRGFPPRKTPKRKPRKQTPPTEDKESVPKEASPTGDRQTSQKQAPPTESTRTTPPAQEETPVKQSMSLEERKRLPAGEVRFKVDSLTEIKARMTKPIGEPSVASVSGAQASNVEGTNAAPSKSLRSSSDGETLPPLQAANLEEKFRGLSSPPPEQLPTGQIVFSRDPRVAKRQQQLLQQVSVGETGKRGDQEKASPPPAEDGGDDGGEENEARMRERLLRRAKYRIRKASDKKETRQSERMTERPTSAAGDSVEESTGIVEPSSKEKSFSPDLIELEDVSAQASPSASDDVDVFGAGAVGEGAGDGGAGEGEGEGRVIVEPETGETGAVQGRQIDAGVSPERREPPARVAQERSGEQSQTEEEGEIPSSSPLPDHRPLPTTGRCYMDMEGYEGRGGGREAPRTDRFEGSGKYDDSHSRRSPEEYDRRQDSYQSGARQQQQPQQHRSRSRSLSWSRSPDAGTRRRTTKSSQQYRRDDSDYSDRYYSDEEYRKRRSDDEYRYRSSGKSKKYQKSRKHRHYADYSDYSDVSDEYYRDSHRSSSSRRSGSRRQYDRDRDRDDYSDYSDYDDRRDRDESSSRSKSKRSKEEEKSSKKKRKHRSRSRSKDSKDSREKERDRDKSKKKKKDKKDRKKKHHRKDGSADESKTPAKPPPNVLVGKVGKVGSFRTLGQKKSTSGGEEAVKGVDAQAAPSGEKTQVVGVTTDAQKSAETPPTQQQAQPATQQQSLPAGQQQQQAADPYYQQQPYYPQATAYPGYDASGYDYQQQQQRQWQWGDQAYGDAQYAGAPYSQGYAQGGAEAQYGEGYVQGDQGPPGQMSEAPQRMEGVESGQASGVVSGQASGVVSGQQTIELGEEEAIAECEMEIEDSTPEKSPKQETGTAASMENQTPESAPSEQANATSLEESSAVVTELKASEDQPSNILQTSDVSMEGQSAADTSAVIEEVQTGETKEVKLVQPESETAQPAVTVMDAPLPPAVQEPSVQPLPDLPNKDDTEPPPVTMESDQTEAQTETGEEEVTAPEQLREEKTETSESLTVAGMAPVDEPLPPGVETLPNPVPGEEATEPVPPPQPPVDSVEQNQPHTGTAPEPKTSSDAIPPLPPLPEAEAETGSATAGGHSTPPLPPLPEAEAETGSATAGGHSTPPPPGTEPEPSVPPPPPPPGTSVGELAVEVPVGEDAYKVPSDDETGAATTTTKEGGDAKTAPAPQETTPESQADQTSQTGQTTPSQEGASTPAEPAQPVTTISTSETTGYAYEGQPQITSSSYDYQSTSAAGAAPTSYDYSAYSQSPAAAPQQGYDYNAYTAQVQAQAGYNYAYNAYLQQQAYSGYTLASDGQYYPTAAYGGYAGVGGSPYAGYYGGGGMYGTTPGYQVAQQQAAASASPQQSIAQPLPEDKNKAKKSDFALAGNKEKQMKSMMEKWSSFKGP